MDIYLNRSIEMNTSKYLIFGVAVSFALIVSGCNNVKSSEVIAQNVSTYEYSDMNLFTA